MAVSRSVVYGPLISVSLGVLWWSYQDSGPTKKAAPTAPKAAVSKDVSDFTEEDFSAHFATPKAKLRPVFMPLVVPTQDHPVDTSAPKEPDSIPADLAGGDPNWTFTGYAVVNGVTMALLENQTTHHSELATKGAKWKTAYVQSVTTASIVLVGKEGVSHVVLRHVAKEPTANKPATGAPTSGPGGPGGANPGGLGNGPRPFNPANGIANPIRGNISLPPGVTIVNSN